MRIPNPKLSDYAQRKLLDELALGVIGGDDPVTLIRRFIGKVYVGNEWEFGRVVRLDRVLHDEVGLKLAQAVTRQLRRRVDARASEREARRQRRLARAA